jgi:polar amino acid transport system substrate-binding protein
MVKKLMVYLALLVGVLGLGACAGATPTAVPLPTAVPNTPTPSNIITIHYHERVPYMSRTGNGVVGLTASPATIAFEQAGIPFQWQLTPSNRQLEIVQENSGRDCMLGWFKNPEREQFAKFTLPLYQDRPMVALARAGNSEIASGGTLEATLSNTALMLLVKSGYSYGPFLDGQIAELAQSKNETTIENVNMVQMIERQRADYLFIAPEEVEPLVALAELSMDEFALIEFSDMPLGNKRYLMCSRQVEDALIEQINRAIEQFVPDAPQP